MKRITTVFITSIFVVSSVFATVESTKVQQEKNLDVTINAIVVSDEYDLNISYDGIDIKTPKKILSDDRFILNSLDPIETEAFDIHSDYGNQNNDLTLSVTVTTDSFKGIMNDEETDTGITPLVVKTDNSAGNYDITLDKGALITNVIKAGPNNSKSLANFYLKWIGKKNISAGFYSSDIKINYSLN